MRNSKRFCMMDGVRTVIIFCVLLGIAVMPACSKKAGEESKSSETVSKSDNTQAGQATAALDKRQDLLNRLKQIQGALIMMQGVTLKKHPELMEEQTAVRTLIEEKMKKLLKPQKVDIQRLMDIQKKLQDPKLPQKEKEPLAKEFQEKAKLSRQARVDAMKDEKVKAAFGKYEAHLKELMKADHPEAEQKMASFDSIQEELRKLQGAAPAK